MYKDIIVLMGRKSTSFKFIITNILNYLGQIYICLSIHLYLKFLVLSFQNYILTILAGLKVIWTATLNEKWLYIILYF